MQKTFWAFPGQGLQRVGMGKELAERFPVAAAAFTEASQALDRDLRELLWHSSAEDLAQTENAQVALTLVSVAALRARQSHAGCRAPAWVAGHSVGSLAAAVACGAIAFTDGIRLARMRGELTATAPGDGMMLAVAVSSPDSHGLAARAADANVEIACHNGPRQLVLSGSREGIEEAHRSLGARSQILNVSHAFHSRLMDPVLPRWLEVLTATAVADPAHPYLSSRTGRFCTTSREVANDLYLTLREPVRWDLVTKEAATCDSGVIFGPGGSLLRMWRGTGAHRNMVLVDDSYRGERTCAD